MIVMVEVGGFLLAFNNKLIVQWCSIGSLGCNANAGTYTNVTLPINLTSVLGYANSIESDKRQGDWAKCSSSIKVSTNQAQLALWSFGAWAANGTKIIIIGI